MVRVVYVNTQDQFPPSVDNTHIELEPISNLLPDPSDQLSPQVILEILKASGVDFSKFQC